ncbi:MAG: hypothetical protein OSJ76_05280 [Alphaproteobacteria bacterium]|nr:hypothetical protein [Alphaproteobacteria bacterium]
MQFKHLIKTSVCALVLLGAVSAQAADDVYVDLSVLNNLQPGDSLFVETQPLFPVVKKSPVKKAVKKKAKKKAAKKAVPVKVDVEETETGKSIVIAPQAPEIHQPLANEKTEEVKPAEPITLPDTSSEAREEIAPVNASLPDNSEPEAAQNDAENSVENAPAAEKPEVENNADVTAEMPVPEKAPAVSEEVTAKPEPEAAKPEAEPEKAVETAAPAPVVLTQEAAESKATVPAAEPEVIKPLIPVEASAPVPVEGQIMFDDGDYTVSPQNAEKIMALINGFEDPQKHKIAIYAYNYDNGENSFKKKKLSLDRATEIRSLLLNKGYKNFSIKVINVTDDAEKRNLVEIEEIK